MIIDSHVHLGRTPEFPAFDVKTMLGWADRLGFDKGIAAGLPLSCPAGKRETMDAITEGKVMHAGTYNSHPVVIAAALVTLTELERNEQQICPRLFALGEHLAKEIREILTDRDVPVLIQSPGPAFHVAFIGGSHRGGC